MSNPKLTPWFPHCTPPVRAGVYERDILFGGYSYYDGVQWGTWQPTPNDAYKERSIISEYQSDFMWRGLAKEPKT